METSRTLSSASLKTRPLHDNAKRVQWYTSAVAVTGLIMSLFALLHTPENLTGMAAFVLMAATVELARVELFQSSRSQVSMSSVIAIAAIVALGPLAGVIAYLASGVMTAVKMSTESGGSSKTQASIFRRTSFNMGMLAVAGFVAGQVFVLVGGIVGNIAHVSSILALGIATCLEWLVNAILLIGVISLQTHQTPLEIWKRDIRWQAPVSIAAGVLGGGILAFAYDKLDIFGLLIVLLPVLSTSYAFRLYKSNMKVYVEGLEALNAQLNEALTDLTTANQAIMRLNAELFHSLAKVFDMRDPYVGGHAAQVATYAVAIATEMGLPSERIEIIRQSAYLHDIGKLAIPEAILHKPGKLTNIEYEFIKKHTDIGADLLVSTEGLKHMAPFVRHHHERWDGGGYPMGLAGEEIPLEARILNLCDSVETMASDRPYHRGMSTKAIVAEVQRCAGTQFDPVVAEIFINVVLRESADTFIVNSARSVTQQYAASILASEGPSQSIFGWLLDREPRE